MFTESMAKLKVYCEKTLKVKYTFPWKLHMVCCHLEPLLDWLGRGLGIVCEQAGEAVHAKFKRTKSRFNKNKYHGKAQKKAVVYWSLWNIHPVNRKTMGSFQIRICLYVTFCFPLIYTHIAWIYSGVL